MGDFVEAEGDVLSDGPGKRGDKENQQRGGSNERAGAIRERLLMRDLDGHGGKVAPKP
jgi:hypothetical protein